MTDALLQNEPAIRMGVFLAMLVSMMVWEAVAPRRGRVIHRMLRWSNNLALVVLDTLVIRLAFPVLAVGVALIAQERGWGVLGLIALPLWLEFVLALLVLDLAIYWQHVAFHRIPVLWRMHRVHHADLEFDVTTGLRFHPAEIVLSMAYKLAVVVALGPPAAAVLVFEVLLNATAMFNHANLALPHRADRALRLLMVTPDMHRVHHSVHPDETNSNYGFNVPWWDRVFGTYRAQPRDGHRAMTIGLEQFRDPKELRLDRMLFQPLRQPDPPARESTV